MGTVEGSGSKGERDDDMSGLISLLLPLVHGPLEHGTYSLISLLLPLVQGPLEHGTYSWT